MKDQLTTVSVDVATMEGNWEILSDGFLKPGGVANNLVSEKELLRNEVRCTVSSRVTESGMRRAVRNSCTQNYKQLVILIQSLHIIQSVTYEQTLPSHLFT